MPSSIDMLATIYSLSGEVDPGLSGSVSFVARLVEHVRDGRSQSLVPSAASHSRQATSFSTRCSVMGPLEFQADRDLAVG